MMCLSVRNPRFSLSHPRLGSVSLIFFNGKDLTIDNNTIPHSFPKKYGSYVIIQIDMKNSIQILHL